MIVSRLVPMPLLKLLRNPARLTHNELYTSYLQIFVVIAYKLAFSTIRKKVKKEKSLQFEAIIGV